MAVAKSLDKTKKDVAKHVTLSKAKGLYTWSRDSSLRRATTAHFVQNDNPDFATALNIFHIRRQAY